MLDSIWQLLKNYGLNVEEISTSIKSLVEVDESGNISGGLLEPIANFPLIGGILAAFGGFAPNVEEIVETTAETIA
jgi:hypothetical protein